MAFVTTTDDLARRFRSDVDDPLRGTVDEPDAGALWGKADVASYMEDAADRVARDVLPTFRTFALKVSAQQPDVRLPAAFTTLDIRRVQLASDRRDLHEVSLLEGTVVWDYGVEYVAADWETRKGTPKIFTREYTPGALRLLPIPDKDDTLAITALTVGVLVPGGPLPLQEKPDIYLMLLWMKKLAYNKHDADTYDPQRSDKFEAEYLRTVRRRKYEAQRVRHAPTPVRFSW